jgi:hypothetical protein
MQQLNPLSSTPADAANLCCGLPGFTLTHTLQLVSAVNPGGVSKAAAVFEDDDIAFDHWTVTRCGDVLTQKIVLTGITEKRATRLRERLASVDGVLRTRIEHYLLRDTRADVS